MMVMITKINSNKLLGRRLYLILPINPTVWVTPVSDANWKKKRKKWTELHQTFSNAESIAWENSQHFVMPQLVSLWNDVWATSTRIPYWWCVTNQIWIVLLIGRSKFSLQHDQSEALPRSLNDVSSVRNSCACFTHVILGGNQWWCREMLAIFSG